MLPVIGPTPHPPLPGDSPHAAPAEPGGFAESSQGSELAETPGSESHFRQHPGAVPDSSPLTGPPDPTKIENRSDSGQFRSENPQPSPLNPQPPWSLQPNEPAVDYNLFAAWLQLPSPRHFRKAASSLGCSFYRLRRLSARHNWKTRAAGFDHYRASTSSLALDQLLRDETQDWKGRLERFRIQEWLLHEEMLQTAMRPFTKSRSVPASPVLETSSRLSTWLSPSDALLAACLSTPLPRPNPTHPQVTLMPKPPC